MEVESPITDTSVTDEYIYMANYLVFIKDARHA